MPRARFPVEGADHFLQDDRGPRSPRRSSSSSTARSGQGFTARARRPPHPRPSRRPRRRNWTLALRGEPAAGRIASLTAPTRWLVEQELDVDRTSPARSSRRVGVRAGRVYWQSAHGHLYALELGDWAAAGRRRRRFTASGIAGSRARLRTRSTRTFWTSASGWRRSRGYRYRRCRPRRRAHHRIVPNLTFVRLTPNRSC